MNQQQRKYLIDKIEAAKKARLNQLEDRKNEPPNMQNYIFHLVMSGKFEVQKPEHIKKVITAHAMKSTGRDYNWLESEGRWGELSMRNKIKLRVEDIIVFPREYYDQIAEYEKGVNERSEMRELIISQTDALIARIQLASSERLQKVVDGIDDLGDISLYDETLKKLTGVDITGQKQLSSGGGK